MKIYDDAFGGFDSQIMDPVHGGIGIYQHEKLIISPS